MASSKRGKNPKAKKKSKKRAPDKKPESQTRAPIEAQIAAVGNPWPDGLPSQVVEDFWIMVHAEEPLRKPPGPPSRLPKEGMRRLAPGGKWLLFVDRINIDEVWAKIVPAVKQGRLGHRAKVATARPNPNARRANTHVICIYTDDAEDRADVLRVREELRRLGFATPISYKPDAMTLEGKYEGSGRIATYYE